MRRPFQAFVVLAVSTLLVTSCGGDHSTKVTHDFTSRMSQLDNLRTRAAERVRTLKSDCSQQLLLQQVCDGRSELLHRLR